MVPSPAMRIPLSPHGTRELLLYAFPFVPLAAAAGWLVHPAAAAVPLAIGGAVASFFRDPERRIPEGDEKLVSPADGTVMDVGEAHEPEYIAGPATRIGIFLSILDVHVNRAPASGRVEHLKRRAGAFHLAYRPEAAAENESNAIGIAAAPPWSCRLLVRQVSGAAARRIVCPLSPGQGIGRGERIGMIKFGSRTEVWIPARLAVRIAVRPGDAVRGGRTVLAVLDPAAVPEGAPAAAPGGAA